MRYALLSYSDPESIGALSDEEWFAWEVDDLAFEDRLRAAGVIVSDLVLEDADTATTLPTGCALGLVHGSAVASPRELGRVLVIEVDDLDAALEVAGRWPARRFGPLEVRPARGRASRG